MECISLAPFLPLPCSTSPTPSHDGEKEQRNRWLLHPFTPPNLCGAFIGSSYQNLPFWHFQPFLSPPLVPCDSCGAFILTGQQPALTASSFSLWMRHKIPIRLHNNFRLLQYEHQNPSGEISSSSTAFPSPPRLPAWEGMDETNQTPYASSCDDDDGNAVLQHRQDREHIPGNTSTDLIGISAAAAPPPPFDMQSVVSQSEFCSVGLGGSPSSLGGTHK